MSSNTEQLDQQTPNVLGMSDDELSRFDVTAFLGSQSEENQAEDTTQTDVPNNSEQDAPVDTDNADDQDEDDQDESDDDQPEPIDENPEPVDPSKPEKQTDKPAPTKDESKSKEKAKTDPESQDVPDHKAFYEQVVGKTFRANGRDIKVDKPEDVIALMQMGANYHEKMAALKPSRRIMKMLEDNKLLDESEIGFLIDLKAKNPQAIAKLVRDSGIDLMYFDVEQGEGYKTKHQAPSEVAITLEDTVQELKASPVFKDTLNAVTRWDNDSQGIIESNPGLLRVFNLHKETGVFDKITDVIARERALGRLQGISDLNAYRAIEADMAQAGTLAPQQKNPTAPVTQSKPVDPRIAQKKKAASSPRQTVQTKSSLKPDNMFALSEEEFAKIDPSQFK